MCQGIRSLLGIHIGVGNDFGAVSEEIISEEFVGQVDLTHDVDEVEQFTEIKSQGVDVVAAFVIVQEVDDLLLADDLSVRIGESCLQLQSEGLHLLVLEHFPQEVRCVEEQRLEEENETHPLVVAMIFRGPAGSNSRKWMAAGEITGSVDVRVGRMNPTISVLTIDWN